MGNAQDKQPKAPEADLSTLPDELLANILKYCQYETGISVRKMNRRIDRITRKYDICNRIPVFKMRIQDGYYPIINITNPISIWNFCGVEYKKILPAEETQDNGLIYLKLDKNNERFKLFLNRTKIPTELCFSIGGLYRIVTVFDAIPNNAKYLRNMKTLEFYCDFPSVSTVENFVNLVRSCPQLNKITISNETEFENVCSLELLGDRKWKELHFKLFSIKIDRKFLYGVVKNCEKLYIMLRVQPWQITIIDIIDFIEECHKDNDFFENQDWSFIFLPENGITLPEIEARLRNMQGLNNRMSSLQKPILRDELYKEGCQGIQIKVPKRPNVKLRFWINMDDSDED